MSGTNTINGTTGNDLISGTTAADKMAGGTGDDTYVVNNLRDDVIEKKNAGTDTVLSSITYTLGANVENLTLTGNGANNATGNELANVILGNSAANVIDGEAGADTMAGGAGNDTYVVDNAGDVVIERAGEGTDTVVSSIGYALGANVENVTLSGSASVNATGNAQDNVLTGNGGSNVLDGGAGADLMAGGAGTDTYIVDDVGDVVVENANQGIDTVRSSVGYTLGANVENLVLTGTAAIDALGNNLANSITGNSAANRIDGGAGADSMAGGGGDDSYVVDNWGDSVVEAAGHGLDTVYSSVSYTLSSNVENLVLTGADSFFDIDVGVGNALDNVIVGNGGFINILGGRAGNDTITGNGGLDWIDGGSGFDTAVYGGSFFDYKITQYQVSLGLGSWSRDGDDDRASAAGHSSTLVLNGVIVDDQRAGDPDGTDYVRNVEALRFSDRTIWLDGRNNAAILSADIRDLIETDSAASISSSGRLTVADFDGPAAFVAQGGTAGAYGTFAIGVDGAWSYTASSAHDEFAAGSTYTDTFDVQSADGTHTSVTIRIAGTNDGPVISSATGANAGAVAEAGNLDSGAVVAGNASASGTLASTDVDVGAAATWSGSAAGIYGTFAIHPTTGAWTYQLANGQANVEALKEGQSVAEAFTATVTDEFGATASQVVTVTIAGTNDSPVITSAVGADLGAVSEAGNLDDGTLVAGTAAASGTLSSSDVDADAGATWTGDAAGTYGTFAIDPVTGAWTYELANGQANVEALKEGASVTEAFTATVTDEFGATATQVVTITVSGTNDSPIITSAVGANLGAVSEAGNLDDGTPVAGTAAASGTLSSSDVDADAGATWTGDAIGTYGSFAIDAATGAWTYQLANGQANVEALKEGQSVTEAFTATVTDEFGATDSQVVIVTIAGTNDSPVITSAVGADLGAVTEAGNLDDGTLVAGAAHASGTLSSTDVDADAGATWTGDAAGTYGTFAIDPVTGAWTYQLANGQANVQALSEGQSVTDSFTATVTDEFGATASQVVIVSIAGTNDSPVITSAVGADLGAVSEAGNLDDGTLVAGTAAASGTLSSSDVDADAGATWTGDAIGAYGTFAISPATGAWTYELANGQANVEALKEGASVTEAFTATVTDEFGATATQVVTITVSGTNDSPIITSAVGANLGAVSEAGNLDDGTPVAGTAAASGTLSSSDVDADAGATWTGDAAGTYGSFAIDAATGAWTYVLANAQANVAALKEGASVTEAFTATVTDEFGATASQVVTVTIAGTNDSPVITSAVGADLGAVSEAGNLDDGTLVAGTAHASGTLSSSDVDADAGATWTGDAAGTYGTFTIDAATGAWTYALANGQANVEALAEGQSVTDSFTATVKDDKDAIATQVVTITITGTNDSPVAAADINSGDPVVEAGVSSGNTSTAGDAIAVGNVLENDADADAGATRTVTAVNNLGANVGATLTGIYGTVTISAGGDYVYTLNNGDADTEALGQGVSVSDVFHYTIVDEHGATSSSTLAIKIAGTNDSPVAVGDTNAGDAVVEAGITAGDAAATGNVLANDTDVDTGTTKTVGAVNGVGLNVGQAVAGTYGSVVIAADGSYNYTLDDGDADTEALAQGASATDVFAYTVVDDRGAASSATLTIAITGADDNRAPTAVADSISASEDVALSLSAESLLANDIDPDAGDSKTLVSVQDATHGTVGLSNGEITFTPDANYNGPASFAYTMQDSRGEQSSATVSVNVGAVNDAPINTLPGTQTTDEDTTLVFSSANGNAITVGDVDDANDGIAGNETLRVTLNSTAGTLTLGAAAGLSFTSGDGTADPAMTFSGTRAAINAALEGLRFAPTANIAGAATVTITTSDLGNFGVGGALSDTDAITINVSAVNDAPTATNLNAAETFSEDTLRNLTDIVISDVDGGPVTATLTLSNPLAGALSTATSGGVTSTYDPATGIWSASGAIASVNALLAGATLNPAANFNGGFTISTSVSDGVAPAITGVKAMTVVSVNDAPVLDASKTPVLASVIEDAGAPSGAVGTLVSSLVNLNPPAGGLDNVTEVDSGSVAGIAVTGISANGSGWYSTNDGASWVALGAVSDGSARLLAADAGTRLYFQPNADYNGTLENAVTFRAWDRTSGTAGGVANVSSNGGTTAFSNTSDTASLTVDAVNDAPKVTAPAPNTFQILSLTANNAAAIEAVAGTGDDRGGMAVSPTRVFLTGDSATARADATTLGNLTSVGARYDALIQNIADGRVYTLSTNGVNPYASGGAGSFTHLLGIDGSTGALDGTRITLSTAITPTANNTGLFSGYNRANIVNGAGAVFNIDFPTGAVTNVGTVPQPQSLMYGTESWARWGVAEFYDGQLYLAYRPANFAHAINHINVSTGAVATIATFSNFSDLASFTVSPSLGKWYFHYEGSGQFRSGDETLGYADATFRTSIGSTVYNATEQTAMNLKNTGWSVSDVDSGTGAVTVTLAAQEGTLNVLAGTSGAAVSNNNSSAVTVTGTVAQINALLNTDATSVVSYTGTSDAPSANDTLTLTVNDNGLTGSGGAKTASGSAQIAITAVNDAPVAVADTNTGDAVVEAGVTAAGDASATGNVLANDSEVDAGDTKTVSAVNGAAANVGASITGVYGSVVIAANGAYTYTLDDLDADTDALAQGAPASDVFTYTVKDGAGATSTATLTVAITGSNDAVLVSASHTTATGSTGEAADGSPAEQANASHAASGTITFSDADAADVHGASGTFVGAVWHKAGGATQALAADPGALSLTVNDAPAAPAFTGAKTVGWDYSVVDSALDFLAQGETVDVTYNVTVSDGAGGAAIQQVTVTLNAANDAPVAVPDTNTGTPVVEAGVNPGNSAFAGNVFATGNATANDTDPDVSDTKTVVGAAPGTASTALAGGVGTTLVGIYGTLSIAADGQWTYNLDNGDAQTQALSQGQTTSDVFSYTVSDAVGAKSTTTLSVGITGTNDAPVDLALSNDKVGRNLADVTIGVLSATDPDNNPITYSIQPGLNGSSFAINGAQLKVASTGITAAGGSVLLVTVRATDSAGAFVDRTIPITVQDRALQTLTAANDSIATGTDGAYVQGTAATLNNGDALNGNTGFDSLLLYSAGTFNVAGVSTFTGFEEIQLINFSAVASTVTLPTSSAVSIVSTGDNKTFNLGAGSNHTITFTGNSNTFNSGNAASVTINASGGNETYNLGAGRETINGGTGADTFVVASATALTGQDSLNGGAGSDSLRIDAGGSLDLRGAALQSIETLTFNASNVVVRTDQTALGGFTTFLANSSGFTGLRIITDEASLNLSNKGVSNNVVFESTNAAGTNFTVSSTSVATQVIGGAGQDTVTASGFAFSAAQRDQIFHNGVEKIIDTGGTWLTPLAGAEFRLTTGVDTISMPAQGGYVVANGQLQLGADSLTGGAGTDVLVLNGGNGGAATFNLQSLTAFSGFEQVRFENESNSTGTLTLRDGVNISVLGLGSTFKQYVLGTGNETITGSIGQDVFIANRNGALTTGDSLDGGAGANDQLQINLITGTNFDLRGVALSNIEQLSFNTSVAALTIDQAALAGVTTITGNTGSRVLTGQTTLDLTNRAVSGVTVESTNAAGTTFTVNNAATAFQVLGGAGNDTLVANFAFSAAQLDQIFLGASIETITDANATYTTPLTGFVQRLTTAGDVVNMPAAGGFVVGTSAQFGGDTLIGGAGVDVLVLNGTGSYNLNVPGTFSGFDQVRLMNESGTASLTMRDGANLAVNGIGAGTKQYFLGTGADTIVSSSGGDSFFVQTANSLSASDALDGGGGFDTLNVSVTAADLRGATLQNIETLSVNAGNATVRIDQAAIAGFTSLNAGSTGSRLLTDEASLNLVGKSVSILLTIASSNAAGTNFTVSNTGASALIVGGAGQDTVTASGFAFSAAQRDQIFHNGVEKIIDTGGTWLTPLSGAEFRLTTGIDTIAMPAQGGYVIANGPNQLNADSLAGGAGTDVLVLNGVNNFSNGFNLAGLAAFSGFEQVRFANDSNTSGSLTLRDGVNISVLGTGSQGKQYTLGTGNEAISGGIGLDVFIANKAGALTTGDSLDGGAGANDQLQINLPAAATLDLRGVPLSNIESLTFNSSNGVLQIDQAGLAGFTSISGTVGAHVVTAESGLNLAGKTVSNLTVESSNAIGTTFTVSNTTTAFQVLGGPGDDTLVAANLGFSTAQRDAIFGGTSIEMVRDFSGLYGNNGSNTLVGSASAELISGGGGNDRLQGAGGADTLTGGAGNDRFVLLAADGAGTDIVTDFSAIAPASGGDVLDISDLLIGYTPGAASSFFKTTASGPDAIVSVDRDGSGGAFGFANVALLQGLAAFDAQTLLTQGNLFAG